MSSIATGHQGVLLTKRIGVGRLSKKFSSSAAFASTARLGNFVQEITDEVGYNAGLGVA